MRIFLETMHPMLAALVQAAAPDRNRAGATASEPYRSIRLVYFIRSLVEYGRELLVTARLRYGTPGFALFAKPFGVTDVRLLVERISQAIRRAAILSDVVTAQAGLGRHAPGIPGWCAPSRREPRERQPAPDAPSPDRQAGRTPPATDGSAGDLLREDLLREDLLREDLPREDLPREDLPSAAPARRGRQPRASRLPAPDCPARPQGAGHGQDTAHASARRQPRKIR